MGLSVRCSVSLFQPLGWGRFSTNTELSDYITGNIEYLKTQVGNPEGPNKPNKKKYDPRVCTTPLEAIAIFGC